MIYIKLDDLPRKAWVAVVDQGKDKTARWQEAWVAAARDRVHNLDLSIPEHREIYESHLRMHIMFNETDWYFESIKDENGEFFLIPRTPRINLRIYPDSKLLKTIGIGFNMERGDKDNKNKDSRREWDAVLGNEVSFDYALNEAEKNTITKEQAYRLFDYSLSIREKELENQFGKYWNFLKPNEKITITSMYYNHPKLIGKNFTENIKKYIKTDDKKYLEQAYNEVKYQSNKDKKVGVQIRMDREALMLESYKCPLYSTPGEAPIPQNACIKAKIGKTVIPRIGNPDTNDTDAFGRKKQYYIWRSKDDDRVRPKHQFYDSKIFKIDNPPEIGHPGDDYNCRCIRDFNIPDFVDIDGAKSENEQIIRKYIPNLFELSGFCIK